MRCFCAKVLDITERAGVLAWAGAVLAGKAILHHAAVHTELNHCRDGLLVLSPYNSVQDRTWTRNQLNALVLLDQEGERQSPQGCDSSYQP